MPTPGATSRREAAARARAARERQQRVKQALAHLHEEEAERGERAKVRPHEKKGEARASTTDPEARVMRMADGGYRPAYNGQIATDATSQIIVAVDLVPRTTDHGQLEPMCAQIERRYGTPPAAMLVDGGFVTLADIDVLEQQGCRVYAPVLRVRGREKAKTILLWYALAHNAIRELSLRAAPA